MIGAKTGAHQLLEQPRLFIGALGAAEPRQGIRAMGRFKIHKPTGGNLQGFIPARRAEMGQRFGRVEVWVEPFRHSLATNQRHGKPGWMAWVVVTKAPFYAQPVLIGRAIATFHIEDLVVLDMVGELAAHPAVGTHRVDLTVSHGRITVALFVDQGGRHQGASGASLNALATGHASAIAHWVVEIKHDLGRRAAVRQADNVVDLHLAASAYTQIALDAGIKIDAHGGVAAVLL